MSKLASRVDRIITEILTSLPPGDLTYERLSLPGRIAFTLRIKQIKVGQIEIITSRPPMRGVRIRFSVIRNNFSIIEDDQEFSVDIIRFEELIMRSVAFQTDEARWEEITPIQLPDSPAGIPTLDQTLLVEQKIYADSAYLAHLNRQPWEVIPDVLWDRLAVKLWCSGQSNREIARQVNVQPRTVANRISALRRLYPHAAIPTHRQRRKQMISNDMK